MRSGRTTREGKRREAASPRQRAFCLNNSSDEEIIQYFADTAHWPYDRIPFTATTCANSIFHRLAIHNIIRDIHRITTQCALQDRPSRFSRSQPSPTPSHSPTSHRAPTRPRSPQPASQSTWQTCPTACPRTSRTRHAALRVSMAWQTSHSRSRAAARITLATM